SGRLGQERIAEPLLPDCPAGGGFHDHQRAAFGVEDGETLLEHRGGGAVVTGVQVPGQCARPGVQGIKVVAAESSADEYATVHDCGRRDGAIALDPDAPAVEAGCAILE